MTAPMPEWERTQRARLDAKRCPDPSCRALPPNHTVLCSLAPVPDPGAQLCPDGCGYPEGTLGARMAHRAEAAA
jgi:hypothetical protein